MTKKQKYYVVWEGVKTGVYNSWDDCKLQIQGYPNARYKSFPTLSEAKLAYQSKASDFISAKSKTSKSPQGLLLPSSIIKKSMSVDAACSGNPGIMEYRGVDTETKSEYFRMGPFPNGTNNIGEFLALVHGLALYKREKLAIECIYSDSKIAIGWIKKKQAKTKLVENRVNRELFELIKRAELWLQSNEVNIPILKWETKQWGEIPADFGRK